MIEFIMFMTISVLIFATLVFLGILLASVINTDREDV